MMRCYMSRCRIIFKQRLEKTCVFVQPQRMARGFKFRKFLFAKTNALIICVFVSAYVNIKFSNDTSHL